MLGATRGWVGNRGRAERERGREREKEREGERRGKQAGALPCELTKHTGPDRQAGALPWELTKNTGRDVQAGAIPTHKTAYMSPAPVKPKKPSLQR